MIEHLEQREIETVLQAAGRLSTAARLLVDARLCDLPTLLKRLDERRRDYDAVVGVCTQLAEERRQPIPRVLPTAATVIDDKEFTVRTSGCLQRAGIRTLHDLSKWREADLLRLKNFGRRSLSEVKEILHEAGLTLADQQG